MLTITSQTISVECSRRRIARIAPTTLNIFLFTRLNISTDMLLSVVIAALCKIILSCVLVSVKLHLEGGYVIDNVVCMCSVQIFIQFDRMCILV